MKLNWTRPSKMERIVSAQLTPLSTADLRRILANEIATLRKEAQDWKRMREALRSSDGKAVAGRTVFEKVSESCLQIRATINLQLRLSRTTR